MKKKVLIILFIIVIIGMIILFEEPFSIYYKLSAEKTILTFFSEPALASNLFGEDFEIQEVKYVRKNIYLVQTNKSKFLIEFNSAMKKTSFNIYEYKTSCFIHQD